MRDPSSPAAAIAVRRLEPGDRAAATAALELIEPAADPQALEALLASPSEHLLLATIEDTAAGYARAHELRQLVSTAPTFVVTEIRVERNHRRQGIGHALIVALKDLARSRGARAMVVVTDISHPAPDGLYASTGGVQTPRRNLVYEYDLTRPR